MAKKTGLLLLAATAGIGVAAAAAGRARAKKKKKPGVAQSPTVVDSGIGFAEKLGINVNWGIIRLGQRPYRWRWNPQDPELAEEAGAPSGGQGGPFDSEEEAFSMLVDAIGLNPLPMPPAPLGEDDGEIPPLPEPPAPPPGLLPPGGLGLAQPSGPGPVAEPPLFQVEIYPQGASIGRLPTLTEMDGIVFSDDKRTVGVGPLWWDRLGDRAEELLGEGVTNADDMLTTISGEVFPMEEIHLFVGPRMLYEQIQGRINEYLEANLG